MATHLDLRQRGSVIRYDAGLCQPFEPRLFEVAWLKEQGHHRGYAAGRGAAHFLHFGGLDLVMRPFLRGGLMQKISRDLYLRLGLEQTRSMREFTLLAWMHGQGLAVPRVVASQVRFVGPLYRAAIITQRIPDARPLEDWLRGGALAPGQWSRIGKVVRRMHDAGVFHADLNRRNILIDGNQEIWLIDFDKCARRAPGPWYQESLSRLHRSLRKADGQGEGLHWTEADWSHLLAGYAQEVKAS